MHFDPGNVKMVGFCLKFDPNKIFLFNFGIILYNDDFSDVRKDYSLRTYEQY